MRFVYPVGATPLDPNERAGLIPDYITTQGELNELEGKNIENAIQWVRSRSRRNVLSVSFTMELHRRMFHQVWKWAGKQRNSEKSVGVFREQIAVRLEQLLRNTEYWIKNKTYSWDEIGSRFHHGLVLIHPFSNGNGRHARLMTDILLDEYDVEPFSWGRKRNSSPVEVEGFIREEYVAALRSADRGNFEPLLSFVRS